MNDFVTNKKKLIKELRNGNEKAYEYLYLTYYKVLCLYASSLTKNHAQSEDIVQNTLLKIWTNRKNLQIHGSLKNYLYKSIYNLFINEYTKKKREESILEKLQFSVLQDSIKEEEENIRAKTRRIYAEIDRLPPKSKKIFVLNKLQGFRYKEISEILGISENTVESHISRALKRIRKNILTNNYFFYLLFFLLCWMNYSSNL